MLIDKFTKKCTIYINIPKDAIGERRFKKFVIDKCLIYGGSAERTSNGTIQNIVNALTVTTKDIEHYKEPMKYLELPEDEKNGFFTAKPNDYIVFDEVDDIVTTSAEFGALQKKYANNGMSINSVNAYIYGLNTDNVTMTNA